MLGCGCASAGVRGCMCARVCVDLFVFVLGDAWVQALLHLLVSAYTVFVQTCMCVCGACACEMSLCEYKACAT